MTSSGFAPAVARIGRTLLAAADRSRTSVLSPLSIALALSAVAEGASGAVAAAFDELLGTERSAASRRALKTLAAFDQNLGRFNPATLPERALLHVANRVLVDTDIEVAPEFAARLRELHGADLERTDLASSSARKILDRWVREHTGGLIKRSAIQPNSDLILVIQNALLFAARWATPFSQHGTQIAPFATFAGPASVPMMSGTLDVPYAEVSGVHAIELSYTDDVVARIYLPPPGLDPALLAAELLAECDAALADGSPRHGRVELPRLDLSDSLDLMPYLPALGLAAATDPASRPFERIIADHNLAMSELSHQVGLRVTEAGTIATAVTEVAVVRAAYIPIDFTFRADRPFLFTIVHAPTGLPIMLAAIRTP